MILWIKHVHSAVEEPVYVDRGQMEQDTPILFLKVPFPSVAWRGAVGSRAMLGVAPSRA